MTITQQELEHNAELAYLSVDSDTSTQLIEEINAIMNLAEQLRSIDTADIAPLFHPMDLYQRSREDVVTEKDCTAQLEALAPHFEDHLYLVPKVIE